MPSRTPPSASAAPPPSKKDSPGGLSPRQEEDGKGKSFPNSRYVTFFVIAAIGVGVDLWTKHVMFAWRGLPPRWRGEYPPEREIHWIVEGFLGIETALNQGALFGMGQGKVWLFVLLSFVAVAGIVYWLFVAKAARDGFLNFTMELVMGGILGNLFDRLGLWGGATTSGETIYAVRDWILISYGGADLPILGTDWPNFNIADSLLVGGAGLLIWHSFTRAADPKETPEPTSETKQDDKN